VNSVISIVRFCLPVLFDDSAQETMHVSRNEHRGKESQEGA
jgi:hypothetical protein